MRRTAPTAVAEAVKVTNPGGRSQFVFICDHASNALPDGFGRLGLAQEELTRHIAWDPGALPVARHLAAALDAALVESRLSRLVIDCNRPLDAPDLIPALSEATVILGNENLSPAERERRIALSWKPFHAAVESLVEERLAAGRETWLVSVHSFTPVYNGVARPWQIGVLHDDDTRLSGFLLAALKAEGSIVVGDNQPYSPADRVYFTLEKHARSRGLPCVMIEIRNNEIGDEAAQARWGKLLAGTLGAIALPPHRQGRAHAGGSRIAIHS